MTNAHRAGWLAIAAVFVPLLWPVSGWIFCAAVFVFFFLVLIK